MYTLVIATVDSTMHIALLKADQVLEQAEWQNTRGQNNQLLLKINELLTRCGITPRQLARVAVAGGPGYYGSLRHGVVIAAMVALGTHAKLATLTGTTWPECIQQATTVPQTPMVTPRYE